MATSFGDYINNLLKNISPTGGMLSPEQQAAYEDAQAYAADPFRRQNAIRKAAEEAAAAAAAQQVAVDPSQKYSGDRSYRVQRTPMQEAYLDWEASTPEGQAVRDERIGNVGKALFGALGSVMPAAGVAMGASQLLQGKELAELTPDYEKILGMGEGYQYGYPVQFLEQYAKTNPYDPQLMAYGKVGNLWDSLFSNQTPAPVETRQAGMSTSQLAQALSNQGMFTDVNGNVTVTPQSLAAYDDAVFGGHYRSDGSFGYGDTNADNSNRSDPGAVGSMADSRDAPAGGGGWGYD
jgi:hypothetical protein